MERNEQPVTNPPGAVAATFSPPEPIRFLSRSDRKSKAMEAVQQLRTFGLVGVVGFLFLSLNVLQPLFGRWAWFAGLPVLAVGGVAVGWYLSSRRRRLGSADSEGRYAGQDTGRPIRLSCVGSVREIEADGPLIDVAFEPRVFWASLAIPPSGVGKVLVVVATVLLGLLSWAAVDRMLGWKTLGVAHLWGAYVVSAVCYAWFRPIYFRVVPGRLDVLRFSIIGRCPVRVQSHDLRSAPILVDLRRHVVFVGEAEASADFCFAFVPGRSRFARAVFMAALSSYEPGPLPDDELLG